MNETRSRQQIAELTKAYCRHVDRADDFSPRSLFHSDSMVTSGPFNQDGRAFASSICRVMSAVFDRTCHSIISQHLDINGDHATGETQVLTIATMREADGTLAEILTTGTFYDRFECRSGIWKFSERLFLSDYPRDDGNTQASKTFAHILGPTYFREMEQDPNGLASRTWH